MVSNIFMQAGNYIQSNNLAYRTAVDLIGYDVPVYTVNRNKEEAREIILRLSIATLFGFLLAPFYVVGLNKALSKHYLNNNKTFFRLSWDDLDSPNKNKPIHTLENLYKRNLKRLENPRGFDKISIVQKYLKNSLPHFEEAINILKKSQTNYPDILNKIYKAKKAVVLADLLVTSAILVNIPPIRNWFTKVFSKKDRFTGTLTYLDDKDLNRLVGNKNKKKKRHQAISIGLTLAPTLTAATILNTLRKKQLNNLPLPPILKKLRNGFDYHSGIFMKNGAMVSIFLATALNYVNVARDTYERVETILKYSIILPSFFYGDLFFNGNIARFADQYSQKKLGTPKGTFYHMEQSNKILAHSQNIQDVMETVEKHLGKDSALKAGKLSSKVFYAGLLTHSAAVATVVYLINKLTRKRVEHDLSKIKSK